MIKKSSKLCFKLLGAFFGVTTILMIIIFGWLTTSSVPLDFLSPYVKEHFKEMVDDIDEISLSLSSHGLGLKVKGLKFNEKILPDHVDVNQAVFYFGLSSVFGGNFLPNRIALLNPKIVLDQNDKAESLDVDQVIQFLQKHNYVDKLYIEKGKIRIKNGDNYWLLPNFSASIDLRNNILDSGFKFHLRPRTYLKGKLVYELNKKQGFIEVVAKQLSPSEFGQNMPQNLSSLKFVLDGEFKTTLDRDMIHKGHMKFNVNPGYVKLDDRERINFESIAFGSHFDSQKLYINSASVKFPDIQCNIDGTINDIWQAPIFDLQLTSPKIIAMKHIKKNWPKHLAPNAINWINKNVERGKISQFALKIQGPMQQADLIKIDGNFNFFGADIRYYQPLPRALNVKGQCHFDQSKSNFTSLKGQINDLRVVSGQVDLVDLDTNVPSIFIDTTTDGAIGEVLRIIDLPPLEYIKAANLKPEQFSGNATTRIKIHFPMIKDLRFEEVQLNAEGHLKDMTMAVEGLKEKIKGDDIYVVVTNDDLQINGQAVVERIPLDFRWLEYFNDKIKKRDIHAAGKFDDNFRARFSIPSYFNGVGHYKIDQSVFLDQPKITTAQLDLAPVAILVPWLNFEKKANIPLSGNAQLEIDDRWRIHSYKNINFKGQNTHIHGDISVDPDNHNLKTMNFAKLLFGHTDVRTQMKEHEDGYSVSIDGRQLDISGLFDNESNGKIPWILDIKSNTQSLRMKNNAVLKHAKAVLSLGNDCILSADCKAQSIDGKPMKLQIIKQGNNRNLSIIAENAGTLLAGSDIMPNIKEGILTLNGLWQGHHSWVPFSGKFNLKHVKIKKMPAMVKLLSMVSVPGLFNRLGGNGISFKRIIGEINKHGNTTEFKNIRADGSSINISLAGEISDNHMKIKGILASTGLLDKVFSAIPIVGNLLTGKDKLGMFAVKFKLKGNPSNPDISVNPLSTITPGIVRDIFS
jgi:uncharacterized protein DUF3971/AsmA-like protein